MRFKTRLIANEEFNGKILEPILIASDGISDTSELFLRSYQMYSMFSYSRDVVKQQRIKKSNSLKDAVELNLSDETLKELKIGKLVQVTMKHLFEEEKISPEEIDKMTQSSYSKQVFNENKPVLKEVPKDGNINELKKDEKNYNRYYAYTISIYGKQYLLVSQWIEDLHRSYYESWVIK
ncbi:hypothetical protein RHG69_04810 [Clostridioides difficile]|nr:hypothetical protein [Clostridioides difficile]